jgi:hypothetical protein
MLRMFDHTDQYRICQWPQNCWNVLLQGKSQTIYNQAASSQTDNQRIGLIFDRDRCLAVLSGILQAVDEGDVAVLTLLDLSAAFDTVDHCILLQQLQISFDFDGPALQWFRS